MCSSDEKHLDLSHKIYQNDPLLFKTYVDKKVSITTVDENVHSGVVYTVDPVSESIVLVHTNLPDKLNLQIIMGHAVKDIKVISNSDTKMPGLFLPIPVKISHAVLMERKNTVKQLFLDNRFQVTEVNEDLMIEDNILIKPPYRLDDCECTNSIILNRIRMILSTLKN